MYLQNQLKMQFEPLLTQEQFEGYLCGPKDDPKKFAPIRIVYFTANWCGACKRIDWDQIARVFANAGIKWMKCDIDKNDYTGGFCGVKSIPAFQALIYGKYIPIFANSSTEDIIQWVQGIISKSK